jgi:small-conductance mechanosensitive channel
MTEKLIGTYVRAIYALRTHRARQDAGQGTLEYVGAVVIAAIVVAAVAAAFKGIDVVGAVTGATSKIFGTGAAAPGP